MRCEQCGRIMAPAEVRLCRERDETLCFECRDDFDADELGLDPEEEFDA